MKRANRFVELLETYVGVRPLSVMEHEEFLRLIVWYLKGDSDDQIFVITHLTECL